MSRQMTPRGFMSGSRASGPALGMLPPDLKPMFDPRPPLVWKPPTAKRIAPYVTGCADLVKLFEKGPPPPVEPFETPLERHARLREAKMKANEEKIAEELKSWDPNTDPNITGDAYKTLFVAGMSYDTTEKKLRREFESFGAIKNIKVITDKDDQPRGYAFIEFESDEAMRSAYKKADGRKVDNKRLLIDVERGRTVRNWKPRRFGGGLGDSRKSRPKKGEEKLDKKNEERTKEAEQLRETERGGGGGGGSGGMSSSSSGRYEDRRSSYGGGASYGGGGGSYGGAPPASSSYGSSDRDRPRDGDRRGSSDRYGGGGGRPSGGDSRYGGGGGSRYGGAADSKYGSGGDPKYGGGGGGSYGAGGDERRKRSRSRERASGGLDDSKRRRGDSRHR